MENINIEYFVNKLCLGFDIFIVFVLCFCVVKVILKMHRTAKKNSKK